MLFLVWAVKVRNGDSGKDGTLQAAVACGFLCMGIGGLLMRNLETTAAPMVLAVVPGLVVLMMVFYLYQKEFFGCAVIGGMGLLGFWVYRTFLSGAVYYGYLALTLVIAAVGVALALKLKQKDGVWTIRGKEIVVLQPGAAYLPYYLTAAVTAILLLAPLALGLLWLTTRCGLWLRGCLSWRFISPQN